MIPALGDQQGVIFHPVDQPVLLVQPAGPPAGQAALERFRLARSCRRRARALADQPVQATEQFAVLLLPVEIILPGLIMKDDLH